MKLITIIEGAQTLATRLTQLRPALAAAAQQVYNNWCGEDDPEIGAGGICDQITMEMSTILSTEGIDITEGGHDGDDHSYLIAYDDESSYSIDIPANYYESGGGYSWTKLPEVQFTPDMVQIHETQRPDWVDEFDLMESDYDGLEDADQFELGHFCDGCSNDFHWDDLDLCACDAIWCDYCANPTGERWRLIDGKWSSWEDSMFDWVPEHTAEFPPGGREHPETGTMIACPRCMSDKYVSPYPEIVAESDYSGLEDADEFRDPDACIHCGQVTNMRARRVTFECSVHDCDNRTCQHCMYKNGWEYDYATDTGSTATCPECLATYDIS
jgi:hypothetical protein